MLHCNIIIESNYSNYTSSIPQDHQKDIIFTLNALKMLGKINKYL